MQISVDTREQKPWRFSDSVKTISRALPYGDYQLVSSSTTAVIERKSEADLVNTLVHHGDRFRQELQRLRNAEYACVVVESGLPHLMEHKYRSRVDPAWVLDRVISLEIDWEIPVIWAGDRPSAIDYATAWFSRIARIQ